MNRRAFLVAFSLVSLSWHPVRSQAAIKRVGVLMGTSSTDGIQNALVDTFVRTLSSLGWEEGKTIQVERRWANGDPAQLAIKAKELIALNPAVVFAQGTPALLALKEATPTIPLVFVNVADPVGSKLVSSLSRPGGNMSGFTNYEQSMAGKWVELLVEAAPKLTRILLVLNPDSAATAMLQEATVAAATKRNIEIVRGPVRSPTEIETAISSFAAAANGGLIIMPDFLTLANRGLIASLSQKHSLPAIYPFRVFVDSGGLMSYGVNNEDMFRRAGGYVDRILRGTNVAELPVQAPTVFELVLNLKTAKAFGLSLPTALVAQADVVIE